MAVGPDTYLVVFKIFEEAWSFSLEFAQSEFRLDAVGDGDVVIIGCWWIRIDHREGCFKVVFVGREFRVDVD